MVWSHSDREFRKFHAHRIITLEPMYAPVLSTIELVMLGMGIGLVSLLPPGPVTLTLVELGTARGPRVGARAGMAVAAGDLTVGAAAVATLALTTRLPATLFVALQVLSAAILVVLGVTLILRPGVAQTVAGTIAHPARSMFVLCTLTPSVFGAWIALLGAMPFATNIGALATFTGGVILASLIWHLGLGSAAGALRGWVTPGHRRSMSRVGGLMMLGFALWALI